MCICSNFYLFVQETCSVPSLVGLSSNQCLILIILVGFSTELFNLMSLLERASIEEVWYLNYVNLNLVKSVRQDFSSKVAAW